AVNYDIGVYFEANGHGTVVFSKNFCDTMTQLAAASDANNAVKALALLPTLVNQAVGDAVSDLLLFEVALRVMHYDLSHVLALYQDAPSVMTKLAVPDRRKVITTDAERKCIAPADLQPMIDAAVNEIGGSARSFVRPSGTEDVVRVYAEADTPSQARALAQRVEHAVAVSFGLA
ncbi:MAG: hypothetical protein MHM6MM_000681, partial [Cercozoa sp. M6MM]